MVIALCLHDRQTHSLYDHHRHLQPPTFAPACEWLAICAGTPGQCSATACIDLSKYPFMNSNTCICNSPALGQIASSAGSAARHYMRAAIGEDLRSAPSSLQSGTLVAALLLCLHCQRLAHRCLAQPRAVSGLGRSRVCDSAI